MPLKGSPSAYPERPEYLHNISKGHSRIQAWSLMAAPNPRDHDIGELLDAYHCLPPPPGSLSTLEKPVSHFKKNKSLTTPGGGVGSLQIWVTFPIKGLKKKA
jgi:hypothetical protein